MVSSRNPDEIPSLDLRRYRVSDWFASNPGIPTFEGATILVACMHCPEMLEVRTGCKGIDDALSKGWSLDGAGDLLCRACTEAREELIGDET